MARPAVQHAREAPPSTKARILATAQDVFAEKGFEGASTREIASRAGVNISSLHYHWDSKETLYFAVFQHIFDGIVQVVRGVATPGPNVSGSVREIIDHAIGQLFDYFNANPTVTKLLLRRLVENDATDASIERDVFAPAWRVFASWTQQWKRPMREGDTMLFMLTVHSMMLLFCLDSGDYRQLLGGSVRGPELSARVRTHIAGVVQRLLESE